MPKRNDFNRDFGKDLRRTLKGNGGNPFAQLGDEFTRAFKVPILDEVVKWFDTYVMEQRKDIKKLVADHKKTTKKSTDAVKKKIKAIGDEAEKEVREEIRKAAAERKKMELPNSQRALLSLIIKNPGLKAKDYAGMLGKSDKTVRNNLGILKQRQILTKENHLAEQHQEEALQVQTNILTTLQQIHQTMQKVDKNTKDASENADGGLFGSKGLGAIAGIMALGATGLGSALMDGNWGVGAMAGGAGLLGTIMKGSLAGGLKTGLGAGLMGLEFFSGMEDRGGVGGGISRVLGGSSEGGVGNAMFTAIKGAIYGFQLGGPKGAVIGAAIGTIGGLMGADRIQAIYDSMFPSAEVREKAANEIEGKSLDERAAWYEEKLKENPNDERLKRKLNELKSERSKVGKKTMGAAGLDLKTFDYGSTGGGYYGQYLMNSTQVQDFLAAHPEFAHEFGKAGINSKTFARKWEEMSKSDSFRKAQDDFALTPRMRENFLNRGNATQDELMAAQQREQILMDRIRALEEKDAVDAQKDSTSQTIVVPPPVVQVTQEITPTVQSFPNMFAVNTFSFAR